MEISEWLKSKRDYKTGCQLYEQYGTSAMYKRIFAMGPGPYNTAKLASELEALCPNEPAPVANAPVSEPPAIAPKFTDASTAIWSQMVPLLDEQRMLHTELSVLDTSAKRLKNATRIMQLADELVPLWEKYHYAKEHNKLPEVEVKNPVPEAGADQVKRLHTLRTYRSRYKNRPDKLEPILAEIKQIEEALSNAK